MSFYKIATHYAAGNQRGGISVVDVLCRKEMPSNIPGVKKEDLKFHVPIHHLAFLMLFVELVKLNKTTGFTKEMFDKLAEDQYAQAGFDDVEYAKAYPKDYMLFDTCLENGVFVAV